MASDAEIDLVVNASGALADVQRDLDALVRQAEGSTDPVTLAAILDQQASLADVDRDLTRLINSATGAADEIELQALLDQRASLRSVQRDLDALVNDAERSGAADPIRVAAALNSVASLADIRGELDDVVTRAQAAAPDIRLRADVDVDDADRDTQRLTGTFGRLIRTAGAVVGPLATVAGGVTLVGAAAAGTASLLAGLVAATESLVPASAVATSGVLTLVVASTSLKLGMQGVGDAIKSAFDPDVKPEDLAEQMKRLAPEARLFVKELASMKGTFKALQLDVQNRLFEGLDKTLESTAKSVLPSLERGVDSAASSFNAMAKGVGAAAKDLGDSGVLGTAIRSSENSLRSLERVPGQLTTAFGQLAAAAGPSLERMASKAADVADRISESLSKSFESGALQDAIELAIDNIQQLGRIAKNVFGGLGNIVDALSKNGEGLFSTLEQITQAFEDLTATKAFQSALQQLSSVMSTLVATVLPLLGEAFAAILPLINITAPVFRDLIKILGASLKPVIQALGPVLEALTTALAKLVPALLPIITLGLQLITDILPILTPLFEFLGEVFERLTPLIQQVADNLSAQLTPILLELPGILEQILPLFLDLADRLLPLLMDILVEIGPSLAELGQALADLLVELAPLIVKFLEFQIFLLDKMMPVIGPLAELIGGVLVGALGALVLFIEEFVIPIVRTIVALLEGDWDAAMVNASQVVVTLKENASKAFEELKRRAVQAISNMVSEVLSAASRLASGFADQIQRLVSEAVGRIASLPGAMLATLGDTGRLLFNAGANIVRGLINGIQSQIAALLGTLADLANKIPDTVTGLLGIHSPSTVLAEIGDDAMAGLKLGFERSIPSLEAQINAIGLAIPQGVAQSMTGVSSASLRAPQPAVNVFIGAERLDARIDFRVDTTNARDTRALAQGMRL